MKLVSKTCKSEKKFVDNEVPFKYKETTWTKKRRSPSDFSS